MTASFSSQRVRVLAGPPSTLDMIGQDGEVEFLVMKNRKLIRATLGKAWTVLSVAVVAYFGGLAATLVTAWLGMWVAWFTAQEVGLSDNLSGWVSALTGMTMLVLMPLALTGVARRDVERRAEVKRRLAKQEETLKEITAQLAEAESAGLTNEARAALTELKDQAAAELQMTSIRDKAILPFQDERAKASRWSTFAFASGLVLIATVVVTNMAELWLGLPERDLTTGEGIVRGITVTTLFYVAGQLFRRSATQFERSQVFEQAAIAIESVRQMANDLPEEIGDQLVADVYRYHLLGLGAGQLYTKQSADSTLEFLEHLNKPRSN